MSSCKFFPSTDSGWHLALAVSESTNGKTYLLRHGSKDTCALVNAVLSLQVEHLD